MVTSVYQLVVISAASMTTLTMKTHKRRLEIDYVQIPEDGFHRPAFTLTDGSEIEPGEVSDSMSAQLNVQFQS